ncbi:MAG: ribosome recycling factor [Acidimicrobiia bacterium]
MTAEILEDAREHMDLATQHVLSEFATVRTGRANPAILQRISVSYYGTQTPLQQLATMSVPEPRLLVVQPYDRSAIAEIEKAIQSSDLGLNPASDGTVLRIVFPPLTEDRRKELIRVVRKMAEDGRVAVRNIRRHAKDDIEDLDISEDDIHRAEKELQQLTDAAIASIDEHLADKEQELLEV